MPKNKLYCIKSVYLYSFVFQCGDALHLSLTREKSQFRNINSRRVELWLFSQLCNKGLFNKWCLWTFNKNINKEKTKIYIHKIMFLFLQYNMIVYYLFSVTWALGSLKDQTVVSCRWHPLHVNRNPVLKPIGLQMKAQLCPSGKLKVAETQSQFSAPRLPWGCCSTFF